MAVVVDFAWTFPPDQTAGLFCSSMGNQPSKPPSRSTTQNETDEKQQKYEKEKEREKEVESRKKKREVEREREGEGERKREGEEDQSQDILSSPLPRQGYCCRPVCFD